MKYASYKCDSCGLLIDDPHEMHMREFKINTFFRSEGVVRTKCVERKKIHLCDKCFYGLNKIAENAAT